MLGKLNTKDIKNRIDWIWVFIGLLATSPFAVLTFTVFVPVVWVILIVFSICMLLDEEKIHRKKSDIDRDPSGDFWSTRREDAGNEKKVGSHLLLLGKTREPIEKDIWLSKEDLLGHTLVLGDDEAGKRTLLMNCAASALGWGSGFCWIDGSGDLSLFAWLRTMARRFDRDEDFLVLNFMTNREDGIRGMTFNPFIKGSSSSLPNLVVGSGINPIAENPAFWNYRINALAEGILRILCWLRDQGELELDVGVFRDSILLANLFRLLDQKVYHHIPESITAGLRSYLSSLVGFQWEKGLRQSQATIDQHGFVEMILIKHVSIMADVYGHIFLSNNPDVDMDDVIMNRRILLVLMPSLANSHDEIIGTAKIVVSAIKSMMGKHLGRSLQGEWSKIASNKPTNSRAPFLCLLNGIEHYPVSGMALMSAQARSLGMAMVYASSSVEEMKLNDPKEATSIIANTANKISVPKNKARNVRIGDLSKDIHLTSVEGLFDPRFKKERLTFIKPVALVEREENVEEEEN